MMEEAPMRRIPCSLARVTCSFEVEGNWSLDDPLDACFYRLLFLSYLLLLISLGTR